MYVANVYIRLCQILPVMLNLKKFLVILITSSAVTFAEESKRYQVSSFIFYVKNEIVIIMYINLNLW